MEDIKMKKFEQDKSIVSQFPPFTREEIQEVKKDVTEYFRERPKVKYFMLLSNELKYYTIFEKGTALSTPVGHAEKFVSFLVDDDFLNTLGELKVLKRTGDDELEIWIGETPFLLFDADSFFVQL